MAYNRRDDAGGRIRKVCSDTYKRQKVNFKNKNLNGCDLYNDDSYEEFEQYLIDRSKK